jgi:MFS family permease
MTLGGFLSDLIGRKKTVIISAILSVAFIYPYTLLLASHNLFNILIVQVVIYSLATLGSGSLTVYYT